MATARDRSLIRQAERYAIEHSDDLDNRVGVVIEAATGEMACGANRIPSPYKYDERRTRPGKYPWMVHAEIDAIMAFARKGVDISGATVYMQWFPCSACAAALCAGRIARIVCSRPDYGADRYHFGKAEQLLRENGIVIDFTD